MTTKTFPRINFGTNKFSQLFCGLKRGYNFIFKFRLSHYKLKQKIVCSNKLKSMANPQIKYV